MRRPKEQAPPYNPSGISETSSSAPSARSPATVYQRHGDRGSGDDDADGDGKLPVYCRFADLTAAGIATNWPHLLRLIDNEGFPTGIMLSRNIRAWSVDEVKRWLAERPKARKKIIRPYKQKAEATA